MYALMLIIAILSGRALWHTVLEKDIQPQEELIHHAEEFVEEVGVEPVFNLKYIGWFKDGEVCGSKLRELMLGPEICAMDKQGTLAGVCFSLLTIDNSAKVNTAILMNDSYKGSLYLEELLTHEMAHCIYDIGHSPIVKIMNPMLNYIPIFFFDKEKDRLITHIRRIYGKHHTISPQ